MANWYSYTPTANGLLTISSDVDTNPATTDTRVSIFTGTCAALVCYNGNDDINPAAPPAGNFSSEITIPVAAGTTYYIAWDNVWNAAGFAFTTNFVANDCLSPNTLAFDDPINETTNSADLAWEAAIGNPTLYDIKWGAVNFNVETEGTLVTSTTNSVTLTGLTENGTIWYYVRSNCGTTQGEWTGPFEIKLAVETPYTNNFDTAGDNLDGAELVNGWGIITSGANSALAESGTAFIFSNVGATASDSWALLRPVSLVAGEDITVMFQTLLIPAAAVGNLELTVGTSTVVAEQTAIASWALTGAAANADNYTSRSFTYNAPADGIYYFGLHNNSGVSATAGSILVDTVSMTSVLSNGNGVASTQFSVFPNPTTGVINIANADNALVNGVEIVDINGRTVKTVKFDNVSSAQINVADLASGMYLMNISSDKGTTTKKIVKN